MIYTSDLDRTLLFSKKRLDIPEFGSDELIEPAEFKNDKIVTYFPKRGIKTIQEITNNTLFIPNTARYFGVYEQIKLFKQFDIKYAIVGLGSNILIDGEYDKEWRNIIQSKLNNLASDRNTIFKILNDFKNSYSFFDTITSIEEVFFMLNTKGMPVPLDIQKEIQSTLNKERWRAVFQGKKGYIIPNFLDKWDAIEHLKERIGFEKVIASGDSTLDFNLLNNADYSIIPRNSELHELYSFKFNVTADSGIIAAEQILDFALNEIKKHKASLLKI